MHHCIEFFNDHSINLDPQKLNDSLLVPFVYYLIDKFNLFHHKEGTEYLFKYLDILNEFSLVHSNSIAEFLDYYDDNKIIYKNIHSLQHLNECRASGIEFDLIWLDSTHTFEYLYNEMKITAQMKPKFIKKWSKHIF